MPEFKERPKGGKLKTCPSTAIPTRQAAQLMKGKYRQQLDQHPDGTDSETTQATDQVEGVSRWVTDETVIHRPRHRQQSTEPSKKRRPDGDKSNSAKDDAPQEAPQEPKQCPTDRPKEKEPTKPKTRETVKPKTPETAPRQRANVSRRRTAPIFRERTTSTTQAQPVANHQTMPSAKDRRAMLEKGSQSQATLREKSIIHAKDDAPQEAPQEPKQCPADKPKEKEPTKPKTRETIKPKVPEATPRQRADASGRRTAPIFKERTTQAPPAANYQTMPRAKDRRAMLEKGSQSQATHRERSTIPAKNEAPPNDPQKPKQRPADHLKERKAVSPKTKQQAQQRAVNTIKERKTATIKERTAEAEARTAQPQNQAVPKAADKKVMLEKSRQPNTSVRELPMETPQTISSPPGHDLTPGSASTGGSTPKSKPRHTGAFKERPRSVIKTRSSIPVSKSSAPVTKVKPSAVRGAKKAVRQTAQQQMTQRMMAQAQKVAKATMTAAKKVAEATVRAVAAMISGLVGLLGGGVLLAVLLLVAIIAAIASSPFGIFFAGGGGGGGGDTTRPTVSVAEAVGQINTEYNNKLATLQAGSYDRINVTGTAPEWPDVLAVFAARYAAADNGVDVATLDADRVDKLTAVFWDMTAISSNVRTIRHPDSNPDDEIDDSWTERILRITITPKTATDMETVYGFTDYQKDAMTELLADRAALSSLAGSLTITNADTKAVLNTLPADLSPDRRKAVQTALQLVGKVNYFWGGKSYVIGWDSRWGRLAKVTAAGSPTTGTFRPYGLDCSGFIDWTLRNAGLHSDGHWYIGTNLTAVTQAEAQPGDMALYPDASHIGMVVGRDSGGKLLVCHCSSGRNNVVVTEYAASGFTVLGRPSIFTP